MANKFWPGERREFFEVDDGEGDPNATSTAKGTQPISPAAIPEEGDEVLTLPEAYYVFQQNYDGVGQLQDVYVTGPTYLRLVLAEFDTGTPVRWEMNLTAFPRGSKFGNFQAIFGEQSQGTSLYLPHAGVWALQLTASADAVFNLVTATFLSCERADSGLYVAKILGPAQGASVTRQVVGAGAEVTVFDGFSRKAGPWLRIVPIGGAAGFYRVGSVGPLTPIPAAGTDIPRYVLGIQTVSIQSVAGGSFDVFI